MEMPFLLLYSVGFSEAEMLESGGDCFCWAFPLLEFAGVREVELDCVLEAGIVALRAERSFAFPGSRGCSAFWEGWIAWEAGRVESLEEDSGVAPSSATP